MHIIGKASAEEIKRMEDMGWKVEEVNIPFFNKPLEPQSEFDDTDEEDCKVDRMICIFVDSDMIDLFQEWHDEEMIAMNLG